MENELELLRARIRFLENKNRVLEREASDNSWRLNPDRAGGAFSQDEIDRARDNWR